MALSWNRNWLIWQIKHSRPADRTPQTGYLESVYSETDPVDQHCWDRVCSVTVDWTLELGKSIGSAYKGLRRPAGGRSAQGRERLPRNASLSQVIQWYIFLCVRAHANFIAARAGVLVIENASSPSTVEDPVSHSSQACRRRNCFAFMSCHFTATVRTQIILTCLSNSGLTASPAVDFVTCSWRPGAHERLDSHCIYTCPLFLAVVFDGRSRRSLLFQVPPALQASMFKPPYCSGGTDYSTD